jgi:hypothetical protein
MSCGHSDIRTFSRPGKFDFACLIPGHYEAGMEPRAAGQGAARLQGAKVRFAAEKSDGSLVVTG